MKYFLIFFWISLIVILFLAIFYMVGGNPNVSGLLYEIFMIQLLMFIVVLALRKKFIKNKIN